jgi:uncharacterized protein with FMN-binding domain
VTVVKKIVLWFMSTLTVVTLLFGYHTSTSSQAAASAESSAVAPVSSGTGSTSSGTSAAAGSTSAPSSSGSSASTTFTGDSATTRWGPVQVEITVANGTVTDVSVVDYPNNNGKDQQINARALPVLVQETLKAQSADIDMVSGATVTSVGYIESLQSALDQAGL